MKYIQPKSVTWWSGVVLAGLQLLRAFGIEIPTEVDKAVGGIGAIGLRQAIGKK